MRARLIAIWNDPLSLDPARISAAVTRKVAGHLDELGKSFEGQGHAPEDVATFLMRCLFTMFAEDVELIPQGSFTAKLRELRGHPQHAQPTLQSLWHTMNAGGFSTVLSADLKRFNGGLFKDATALPLNALQLGLLIDAASHDWRAVEPVIFDIRRGPFGELVSVGLDDVPPEAPAGCLALFTLASGYMCPHGPRQRASNGLQTGQGISPSLQGQDGPISPL